MKALLFATLALSLSNAHATATCSARAQLEANAQAPQAAAQEKVKLVYGEKVQPRNDAKPQSTAAKR